MTPDRDPMELLERANPVPEGQLTDEDRREAEALLARIATTPRARRPRRRSLRVPRLALAAGLAACVVAALVVADLIDSDGNRGGIAAKAAAAVSDPDAVYHVVQVARTSGPGLTGEDDGWMESWTGPGKRSRWVQYRLDHGRRGRLAAEIAFNGDTMFWYDADSGTAITDKVAPSPKRGPRGTHGPPGVDLYGDPASQLRDLERRGRLHAAGRATVRGRPAYRLVSDRTSDRRAGISEQQVTFLVDARTYFPLRMRTHTTQRHPAGTFRLTVDYPVYEKLPATPRNLLELRHGHYRAQPLR